MVRKTYNSRGRIGGLQWFPFLHSQKKKHHLLNQPHCPTLFAGLSSFLAFKYLIWYAVIFQTMRKHQACGASADDNDLISGAGNRHYC